jgi:hypothetical protein
LAEAFTALSGKRGPIILIEVFCALEVLHAKRPDRRLSPYRQDLARPYSDRASRPSWMNRL